MECPVCKNQYSVREIESHVDQCIAELYVTFPTTVPQQKRQFPFEEKGDTWRQKKYKSNSTASIPGAPTSTAASVREQQVPLTERLRPNDLDDYVGQKQVVGSHMLLRQLLSRGHIPSMILWGPPGCGKTSLANVIGHIAKRLLEDKIKIVKLSAVNCGVNDIRTAVSTAKEKSKLHKKTIVFMDEIHRFNKLQQDIFLPHVEAGTFTLIGTTTENPSYSLNSALLSRCRVFALKKLTELDIRSILDKAVRLTQGRTINTGNVSEDVSEYQPSFMIDKSTLDWLAEVSDGDARVALNGLEVAVKTKKVKKFDSVPKIKFSDIKESLKRVHALSDRETNNTHHLYSALFKSVQAGNANAGLYWLARLMAVKEDPVDIGRRLVRISSEYVGLSDPDALGIAVHTMLGCEMIGMPECDVLLGQCVVYLSKAPKSRVIYDALKAAENLIINHEGPQPDVPLHIKDRSAERKLRAALGKNQNSLLRKSEESKTCLPAALDRVNFF